MNASSPQVIANGMPMIASATESSTATMSPKTVVTSRYWRVPQAKCPSASVIVGRSTAIDASRSPTPPASTLRNSSSASRNTKLVARPATLLSSAAEHARQLAEVQRAGRLLQLLRADTERRQLRGHASSTRPSAADAYFGSSVASRAIETMIPRASPSMIA